MNEHDIIELNRYLESVWQESKNKKFSICPVCRDPIYKCKKCDCCDHDEIRCWRCVKYNREIGHYET